MTEPQARRSWTLRGRMLKWLGLTSGAVAVALSATGIWFIDSSANQQIEELLSRKLMDISAEFEVREVTPTALLSSAERLARLYPSSQFAWRVWAADGGGVVGEFGVGQTLQPDAPAAHPLDQTVGAAGGFYWRATRLESGETVALMLDEAPHRLFVDRYVAMTVLIVVIGFGCIFLVGKIFSTRVSQLLSRIAEHVGKAQASSEEIILTVDDLPQEISEVAVALEELLRSIREETKSSRILIAGVAHELRAPIQNLIGETEVVLMSDRSPDRYQKVLQSHLEELRYLGDGVHNLVSLCSAKTAAQATKSESFDLYREVRYRLEREVRRAKRMEVELEFESSGDLSMRGDREALLTAMRNLTSNALDWVPADGRVHVEFRADEADCIRVLVEDNGPGVPEAVRERIFEPFFRGPSAEGKRVGYGLGLALAHSAVVAQGGSICVGTSELGGARFELFLPRERSAPSTDEAPAVGL